MASAASSMTAMGASASPLSADHVPATAAVTSTAEQARLVAYSKRAAAFQAVKEHLEPHYTNIGIGSGSTVVFVVEAIAQLDASITSRMRFYPTGEQSRQLIKTAGLPLSYLQDLPGDVQLDVAFDGADEVDVEMNLIKGGGACLLQEKLVVTAAKKFVCVADFRKMSERLGTQWTQGIPIEVLPLAASRILDELKQLGSLNPQIRSGLPGKAGSIVTDNGMSLIDAPFLPLKTHKDDLDSSKEGIDGVWSVDALADRIIKMTGVVEVGLFTGKNGFEVASGAQKPVASYFGMADGTVQVRKA